MADAPDLIITLADPTTDLAITLYYIATLAIFCRRINVDTAENRADFAPLPRETAHVYRTLYREMVRADRG